MIVPTTPDELLAAITSSVGPIVVTGADHSIGWPTDARVISTRGLTRIIEHEVQDLTVTCETGVTLGTLQEITAAAGQRLAVETATPQETTIGGIIAAPRDGFLRSAFGPVRDQLLGVAVALADGTICRAGGRVVKNVTGYELTKLLTGSRGTLGIITEVTLRLRAAPACTQVLRSDFATVTEAFSLADNIRRLPGVTGIAVECPQDGAARVLFRVEGREGAVEDIIDRAHCANGELEFTSIEDTAWQELLDEIAAAPVDVRLRMRPSRLGAAVEALAGRRLIVDAAAGIIDVLGHDDRIDDFIRGSNISSVIEQYGAHAFVPSDRMEAEHHARRFGAPASTTSRLIRRIKAAFDPNGVMNPHALRVKDATS